MDHRDKTRRRLIAHCQAYPKLQIQDVFKFLHQSVFGCEHLVSSLAQATDFIRAEYSAASNADMQIERLDGAYSRVPLAYMKTGLSAETLGKLFVASARQAENGASLLTEKLLIAKQLTHEGALPFSHAAFKAALTEWAAKGYPAVRHSDVFREHYHPSYRVIANEYIPYLPLIAALDKRQCDKRIIVAIEGGSAAGKTTLSRILQDLYPLTVFHMDDFFLRPEQRTPARYAQIGGNIDHERFLAQVLQPLRHADTVELQRFDCTRMALSDSQTIHPKSLVLVEGAYCMHPTLAAYYDLSVFLDIDPALQRQRILRRNSPALAQRFFKEWIPLENTYFAKTDIQQRCDMTIRIEQE